MAAKKAKKSKKVSEKAVEVVKVNNTSSNKKRNIIAVLVIALIIGLFLFTRKIFVAATVNGQPIPRFSVISELEKQGGSQVLESIITKTLVAQEAKKQKIVISQSEIDEQIATFEEQVKAQGQTLDSVLELQGMTRQNLIDQIKLQKYVEKMSGSESVTVAKEEIDEYIKTNTATPTPGQSQEDFRKNIEDQLLSQKQSEKIQTFLTDLKSKAKIDYLIEY